MIPLRVHAKTCNFIEVMEAEILCECGEVIKASRLVTDQIVRCEACGKRFKYQGLEPVFFRHYEVDERGEVSVDELTFDVPLTARHVHLLMEFMGMTLSMMVMEQNEAEVKPTLQAMDNMQKVCIKAINESDLPDKTKKVTRDYVGDTYWKQLIEGLEDDFNASIDGEDKQ
jgi:hypothetical protein